MIDRPLVNEDHGALRDVVAFNGSVVGCCMWDGDRDEAGVPHDLVEKGHDVRQLRLVLDGRESAPVHHFVDLFSKSCLDIRKSVTSKRKKTAVIS